MDTLDDSDVYRTIDKPSQGIYKEKGSKFLSFAFRVFSENEVKDYQKKFRSEYFDARHQAYAFRLGADKKKFRAGDDGEPAGTSGLPILNVIQSNDLSNILIIVVRYFGGTKLGVPGLIHAYKSAAADALAHATIVELTEKEHITISFPYEMMNQVMKFLKETKSEPYNQHFDNECILTFDIRKRNVPLIIDMLEKMKSLKIVSVS